MTAAEHGDRPRRIAPSTARARRRRRRPADRAIARGGATRSSTRSTCAASPTGTATGRRPGRRPRRGSPYLRDLGVDAIWFTPWYVSPLADGGYDVADYRAIDPAFGTLGRGRGADRRGPRARDPDDRRHRPEPRLRPAPVVPGRARPPGPARPSARGSGSTPAAAPTATSRRTTGRRTSAARPGPAPTNPDGTPGRVVPAPVRARAARPQLGPPGRPARARGRPALLVRPRRRRHPHRLGGPAGEGPDAAGGARTSPAPGEHPYADRDELHEIYRELAGDRRRLRRHAGRWSARCGCADAERFARYLRPDELHTAFNFDFLRLPVGRRQRCARRSTRRWPPTRRSARRRPGCSRTTTSPGP